jgi:membrane-bound lytic murein transglycosylase F
MGYEFELLQKYADDIGVELEILVVNNIDSLFIMLNEGVGDLIAYNLTVTKERKRKILYTNHYLETRQVLVQRKPSNWRALSYSNLEKSLIRNVIDLENDTIYVRKGSSFISRLFSLSEEIGGEICIEEVPDEFDTEALALKVAQGEIPYSVADENVGLLLGSLFPELDVKTALSLPQRIAFGTRLNNLLLKESMDNWLGSNKTFSAVTYNKYFKNRRRISNMTKSQYYAPNSGQISKYDDLVKKEAERLGWDWRLLTSVIYQESRFDPEAVSWAGAEGLMQLIPATAQRFGLDTATESTVSQNIHAGVNFLIYLEKYWTKQISDSADRVPFVLASYNAGLGHVLDAKALALKYEGTDDYWFSGVEEYILKKSNKKYYTDSVVKQGYCRGIETYKYVREIANRYEHYLNLVHPDSLAKSSIG